MSSYLNSPLDILGFEITEQWVTMQWTMLFALSSLRFCKLVTITFAWLSNLKIQNWGKNSSAMVQIFAQSLYCASVFVIGRKCIRNAKFTNCKRTTADQGLNWIHLVHILCCCSVVRWRWPIYVDIFVVIFAVNGHLFISNICW